MHRTRDQRTTITVSRAPLDFLRARFFLPARFFVAFFLAALGAGAARRFLPARFVLFFFFAAMPRIVRERISRLHQSGAPFHRATAPRRPHTARYRLRLGRFVRTTVRAVHAIYRCFIVQPCKAIVMHCNLHGACMRLHR